MTCAIDATVGGPFANSYATVAQADAYWQTQLRPDEWVSRAADTKCRALVMATRLLDDWVVWDGQPAAFDQALAWPRWGLVTVAGNPIQPTELPGALVAATAELARVLCAQDVQARPDQVDAGLTAMTVGPLSFEFAGPGAGRPEDPERVIPPRVWSLISRWARGRQGDSLAVPLLRA